MFCTVTTVHSTESCPFWWGGPSGRGVHPCGGLLTLATASEGFYATAVKYLSFARDQEADDPLSAPWYNLELGREQRDREVLSRAIADFQEKWESRLVEECSREILYLSRRDIKISSYWRSAAAIYSQNPGGLIQYGLKFPLHLSVSGEESRVMTRLLKKQMNHSGLYLTLLLWGGRGDS